MDQEKHRSVSHWGLHEVPKVPHVMPPAGVDEDFDDMADLLPDIIISLIITGRYDI